MRLIDADQIVTYQTIDVMNDETITHKETIADALDELTDEGCPPTVSGWVSVKDRLPEEKGWYMVYAPGYSGGSSSGLDSHNGVMFAKWSGKTWSIEVGYHKRPGCVRQWMPLPEPPEEVKGDA